MIFWYDLVEWFADIMLRTRHFNSITAYHSVRVCTAPPVYLFCFSLTLASRPGRLFFGLWLVSYFLIHPGSDKKLEMGEHVHA